MAAQEVLSLNVSVPQVEAPQSGSTYTFPRAITGALPLGVAGTALGSMTFSGNTSGTVTVQPAAAAGTWSLTLPITGGTANYALTTNGSGVSTWAQISLTAGVTGTLPAANGGTGITALGTGVAPWLGTPSSANLAAAITDETGTGALVFATTPTLVTPVLGAATGTSITLSSFDKVTPVAVASLPAAATAGMGARAFVNDGSTTLVLGLGLTVAGGGSNKVPVYSDGTNWIVG